MVIKPLTSIFVHNKKIRMQRKRYITFFFIFISMVMLVVPVIPHHHHNNGLICMKNDITPNCCGQQHTPDSEHCFCDTGCVTTLFFQQTPSSDNGWTHPDFPLVITLFSEPLLRLLVLPEESGQRQDCIYQESLHGTYLTRATGLRAPPCVLTLS